MGKFTDTKYTQTIDNLVKATQNKINNPYYKYSDKKPTKVTYYRQNREKTTLDEFSKDIYQHVGDRAPTKFNKIIDFYIYGFGAIQTTMDVGDFGLEAGEISGTAIVLPNTIEPRDGDFFAVPYLKEDLLFKVNSVSKDTLEDGANVYQFEYKLEKIDSQEAIEKQVVKTYRYINQNVGTEFSPLIEDTSYTLIEKLDVLLTEMTSLYQIFFNKDVQNFVFTMNGEYFYDPYLIEFILRNKLMSYGDEYIYVGHGTSIPKTFGYDYSKTFFNLFENPEEMEKRSFLNTACALEITDVNSLFVTRLHSFYKVEYTVGLDPYMTRFNIFPAEVVDHIKSGEYFTDEEHKVYNLMISYFHEDNSYISDNIIDIVKYTDYCENKEYYYLIPIDIFIINRFIESLMK